MGLRTVLVASALLWPVSTGMAAGIDLSQTYGDEIGCLNREGQEVAADFMLLVNKTAVVTAASVCEVSKSKSNKNGTLTLTTFCESEGQMSEVPTLFVIARDKSDKKALLVTDEEGNLFGKVSVCP